MKIRRKGTSIKNGGKNKALVNYAKGETITLPCKLCGRLVDKCDPSTVKVTCSICVQKMVDPPKSFLKKPTGPAKAKGWKFMKVYVDSEKNVYFKGEEQPDMKGTLDPTVIVPKPRKRKLTPREKEKIEHEKNDIFAEIMVLKKQLLEGNLVSKSKKKVVRDIMMREKKIKRLTKTK